METTRLKRLIKEGFWIVIGQIAVVVGMMVGVKIITGYLDPNAYGELALGMTLATLIGQTLMGPISNGIMRFYAPASETLDVVGYFKDVKKLVRRVTVIAILIFPVILVILAIIGRNEIMTIAILSLVYAIVKGCNSILNGIQNAARQRSIVALHQGLDPWFRFIIAAILMTYTSHSAISAIIGYTIAAIMILISQYAFFGKVYGNANTQTQKGRNWYYDMVKFSWPFVTWGLFTWAQQISDRWALNVFQSTYEVGLYAVLYQMGYFPILMASGLAVQFFTPILYQRAGDASDNNRNANVTKLSYKLASIVLLGTISAVIISIYFHSEIFMVFIDDKYAIVSYLLPWVFLSSGVFAAGQVLSINIQSQMKTRSMIEVKIYTAIIGVVGNCIGAYYYGISGVVGAGLFFSLVHGVWMLYIFKRELS